MQQALIFWPLSLLVLRAMATLCPVHFCAVEDRRHGRPDLRRGGLGGTVAVTPVAVEVWMLSSWNDWGHVRLGRGSRAAVDYAWSHLSHRWERVLQLGAPVAPRLARGLDVSLGRGGSRPRGSDTFDDIMGARAR
jgi:hypothetical protein